MMAAFWQKKPGRVDDPRHALGRRGENEAARYLQGLGHEIVDKNVRTRHGEIDLITRHKGTLVFVEVKARTSEEFAPPELSVDERKRRKLLELAQAYLSRLGEPVECRFDVLAVVLPDKGRPVIRHIQNAFQVDVW